MTWESYSVTRQGPRLTWKKVKWVGEPDYSVTGWHVHSSFDTGRFKTFEKSLYCKAAAWKKGHLKTAVCKGVKVQMYKSANVQNCKCSKLQMFKIANVQNCKCTNMQMCKSASCALLMDSRRGRLGERRRGALLHYCAISVQLQSVANCLQNRFDNLLAHLYLYSFYFLKHLIYWTVPWKKFKGEKIEDKQKSLSKNIHNPRVPSGPKPLRREFQSGPFWSKTLRHGGTI